MSYKTTCEKLNSFTKEEIIYGIKCVCPEFEIRDIIRESEKKRIRADYDKVLNLSKEATKAFEVYGEFLYGLCVKYGDGKKVNFLKVPFPELEKLSELETSWRKKDTAWAKAAGLIKGEKI